MCDGGRGFMRVWCIWQQLKSCRWFKVQTICLIPIFYRNQSLGWQVTKAFLYGYINILMEEWSNISINTFIKLVESLPKMFEAVTAAENGQHSHACSSRWANSISNLVDPLNLTELILNTGKKPIPVIMVEGSLRQTTYACCHHNAVFC